MIWLFPFAPVPQIFAMRLGVNEMLSVENERRSKETKKTAHVIFRDQKETKQKAVL